MSHSRKMKEELHRIQAEYEASLTTTQGKIEGYKKCINRFFWRPHSKCSGEFNAAHDALVTASRIEEERNQLASQLPGELNAKSMHRTCMQEAEIIKETRDLLYRTAPLDYLILRSRFFEEYAGRLRKCKAIERTLERSQEISEVKGFGCK